MSATFTKRPVSASDIHISEAAIDMIERSPSGTIEFLGESFGAALARNVEPATADRAVAVAYEFIEGLDMQFKSREVLFGGILAGIKNEVTQ